MLLGNKGVYGGGSGRAFDADMLAWEAAVIANGGSVSLARRIIVDQFVFSEKASGAWDLTDDYWGLWGENAPQSLTSLKQRRLATAVNSPAFTVDRGYLFDGATNYIDTGFTPVTHGILLTGTDQRLAIYERTNLTGNTYAMGMSASGTVNMTLRPRASTAMSIGLNAAAMNFTVASSLGYSVGSRAAGGLTIKAWRNGVALPDATAASTSTTEPALALTIGCVNGAGGVPSGFRAAAEGFAAIGAPLSDAQEVAHYNAVQAWATAIGANV